LPKIETTTDQPKQESNAAIGPSNVVWTGFGIGVGMLVASALPFIDGRVVQDGERFRLRERL
jgi:hypothetical protein